MGKLIFAAPRRAPAHIALCLAAKDKGFDEAALRRLFWLVNAHPKLIGHARVFKHICDHLTSRTFQNKSLVWANKKWAEDIPAWVDICDWLWKERASLARRAGLTLFDQQPTREGDHPHLNEGVVRHGVPAALWNSHESLPKNSPPAESDNAAALRYFELQGHLLAATIECRYRLSTLDFYQGYSGELERPVAPMRSAAVSPAVRELSLKKYSPLVTQLPSVASTKAFAVAIEDQRISLQNIPDETRHRAKQYLDAVRRYFHRYLRVLEGWRPIQSARRGWGGGGGGHARRPGFVPFSGVPGVYVGQSLGPPDDPDIADQVGQRIFVDCDSDNKDDPDANERSGIAPAETLEEAFHLYSAAELKGRLMALRRQRLAVEMRSQALSFNYHNLTPQELRQVWLLADKRIARYLRTESAAMRNEAIASMILKLSLCFGQKIDTVRTFRLIWLIGDNPENPPSNEDVQAGLVLSSPKIGAWNRTQFVGLRLPALMPIYKTSLPDELDDCDREYQPGFVLPDLFELGDQLINFLRIQPNAEGQLFGIQAKTLRHVCGELCKELNNKRVTPDNVARALPTLVTMLTGDQSLTWLLTADASFAGEPRMHYTRQPVCKLLAAYRRAARRLSRIVGIRISLGSRPTIRMPDQAASVGARFVLARNELRELVSSLSDELSDPDIARTDSAEVVRYHNLYVLFTGIYQSLDTSMRVITSPSSLYLAWSRQRDKERYPVRSSLSDKDTDHSDKARLALIGTDLATQFAHYRTHEEYVGSRRGISLQFQTTAREYRPFFTLSDDLTLEPLTPGWLAKKIHEYTGYPIPANFHRAFLRTELLERGCPAEIIDAFLGHFNQGESPFATFSSFDFRRYCSGIDKFLRDIHDNLGLRPIKSRLVPPRRRMAAK